MIKKAIMNLLKAIINLPKTIAVLYSRWIAKDTRKTMKEACIALKEYAADVIGIQLNEGSFAEVKCLYLASQEHGFNVRETIFISIEVLITYMITYVYFLVEKKELFMGFAESVPSFVIFFFAAFYIPRKIKVWCSKKSRRAKAVESLNYALYKNLIR